MKRVISFLLTIVMIFSMVAGLNVISHAATRSQAEAIEWIKARGNESWWGNIDGAYGCQCVDLIMAFYQYFGYSRLSGNACDYMYNHLPSGSNWHYSSSPTPGCVFVKQADSTYTYGHVGLVYAVSGSTMYTVETNLVSPYDGAQGRANAQFRTRSVSFANTFIVPDFAQKTPVNLGNDFFAYIIKNDTWHHLQNINRDVKLSNGNDSYDPSQIWHFAMQGNGQYEITNEFDYTRLDVEGTGNTDRTNVHTYPDNDTVAQRWYIYESGNGYNIQPVYTDKVLDVDSNCDINGTNVQLYTANNSAAQNFCIYKITTDGWTYQKPSPPNKVNVNTYVSKKTITFKWNQSTLKSKLDAREYDIRIYKNSLNGTLIHSKFKLKGTTYSYTVNEPGDYYVTVAAVNSKYYNYYSMSDAVKFTISATCSHSYSSTVTKSATCTAAGVKTFTCSKCGHQYTQSIAVLGHNYSGTVTKAATCTEKGVKTFKCSRCTSSYTQDIAALGHDIKTRIYEPAEVTQTVGWSGSTADYCTRCDYLNIHTWSIERVVGIDLAKTTYTYSGKTITPSVKVVDFDGKVLKQGTDYTVKYASGRKNVGKYAVKVSFQGKYTGSRMLYFKIVPKGTTLSKLTAGKKAFTAKWKKLGGITGYQIQYSTKANFSGAKLVTVKGATSAGKTIKNLKAKQVYYVRVRTYKTVSGSHYMSAWSKTYKVKTK